MAGSIVWALRDFRVEPELAGGAPLAYATPPWNNKSLIDETNARKPVYFELRKRWRQDEAARMTAGYAARAVKRSLASALVARGRACSAPAAGIGSPAVGRTAIADDGRQARQRRSTASPSEKGLDARGGRERDPWSATRDRPADRLLPDVRARPRRAQFEGDAEGAEQIGSALLFVRKATRRRRSTKSKLPTDLSASDPAEALSEPLARPRRRRSGCGRSRKRRLGDHHREELAVLALRPRLKVLPTCGDPAVHRHRDVAGAGAAAVHVADDVVGTKSEPGFTFA